MYSKIDSKFWDDEKIQSLSIEASYLVLYLLTCKHRNIMGCYSLPKGYAQSDTRLCASAFEGAWNEIIASGIIKYDEKTRIVLVCNFLKYNGIENPNQVKGALERLSEMPRSVLYLELIDSLSGIGKEFLKPLIDGLSERLPKPFSEPFAQPFRQGLPKPDNSKQITERITTTANVCARESEPCNAEEHIFAFSEDLPPEMCDSDFIELQRVYQERIQHGNPLDDTTCLKLAELCNLLPASVLIEAVNQAKETAKGGQSSFRHVETIAQAWKNDGVDSIEKVLQQREERKSKAAATRTPIVQKGYGKIDPIEQAKRVEAMLSD